MKPTRRGFIGLVGGAVGAAVTGLKLTPAEAAPVKGPLPIAPTFKIDVRSGPPWVIGDVVKKVSTGALFYVRAAELARERNNGVFGGRGTGIFAIEREAEPGSRVYKQGGMPGLVLVPFMSPEQGQVIPLQLVNDDELVRVGRAYNEAGSAPLEIHRQ